MQCSRKDAEIIAQLQRCGHWRKLHCEHRVIEWTNPSAGVVDICLIPEIEFAEDKLMGCIQQIIDRRGHAVVCVAEGAGQALLATKSHATDASGNPILEDIGIFLRDRIKALIKVSVLQPRWGSRGL
jgi:6-phosphofructokinase